MLAAVEAGSDMVIASRYRDGARDRGLPAPRRSLSLGARWLFRAVLPITACVTTRVVSAPIAQRVARGVRALGLVAERGFSCMVDILLRLAHPGANGRPFALVVSEMPLDLRYDFKQGASKMRVARTVGATLKVMLRHRFAGEHVAEQHSGG